MPEKQTFLGKITKVVFIGGAILFFILLAYLIIIWIPQVISLGSSIGKNTSKIVVTANEQEVITGNPFAISWTYNGNKDGEYYLSYSCDEASSISIESSKGPQKILCNTPFRLGEGLDNVSLIPTVSKANTFVDSKIAISYRDLTNKSQIAYGDTTVTLKNSDKTATSTPNQYNGNLSASTVVTKASTVNPNIPTKPITTNYGRPDLQISNIREIGDSTLSFDVFNIGTKSSGSWYFSYTDAENPSRVIQGPLQMSLAPGQGMLTTVRFNSQRNESQLINIDVDPYNMISESNENNNLSSVLIHGNRNYYSDNNNSYGNADLVIEDIMVGRMSGSSFIEDDRISKSDTAAVRFTVRNDGGDSTGKWKFKITDTPNDEDYTSSTESSLDEGDDKTFTVKFDSLDKGTYDIRLKVDSSNNVDEENESNNTDTIELEVTN